MKSRDPLSCRGELSAQPQWMSMMYDHVAVLYSYTAAMLGLLCLFAQAGSDLTGTTRLIIL